MGLGDVEKGCAKVCGLPNAEAAVGSTGARGARVYGEGENARYDDGDGGNGENVREYA
jgi:hypothetical protein